MRDTPSAGVMTPAIPAPNQPIAAPITPFKVSPAKTIAAGPFPMVRSTFDIPGIAAPLLTDVDTPHLPDHHCEVDAADHVSGNDERGRSPCQGSY